MVDALDFHASFCAWLTFPHRYFPGVVAVLLFGDDVPPADPAAQALARVGVLSIESSSHGSFSVFRRFVGCR